MIIQQHMLRLYTTYFMLSCSVQYSINNVNCNDMPHCESMRHMKHNQKSVFLDINHVLREINPV